MKEKKSFEVLLKELEEVVKKLEDKDIELDDAIKYYKLGLELSKELHEYLESAKQVVVETV